jgi:hypothetical protein
MPDRLAGTTHTIGCVVPARCACGGVVATTEFIKLDEILGMTEDDS